MSSLRPTSVSDTTPLQHLESQSSSSEPSSPSISNGILMGNGNATNHIEKRATNGLSEVISMGNDTGTNTTTGTTTDTNSVILPVPNHNNNKIDIGWNNYANGIGKVKMDYHPHHQMQRSYGTQKIFKRIFLDLCILACVILPLGYYHCFGEPYKRGFFCNDDSLKHPYKESTMKGWMLALVGFGLPVALITLIEFYRANGNESHRFNHLAAEQYNICHLTIPEWVVECYKRIGFLIYGACVSKLTADIAKFSVGRLRPHFFSLCQPVMLDGTTCDDPINAGLFIEKYRCIGENATARMQKEMRLSFPSGHASFCFYTIIYIVIYLQKRMTWQRSKMLKHLIQSLFLLFAWYTALTRVSDYKHHWTDVLAGSLIGALYAIIVTSSMW